MATITKIIEGKSNLGFPYCYGELDCGHTCDVETIGATIDCRECGHVAPFVTGVCASCGSNSGGNIIKMDNPHDPADRLSAPGDARHCKRCDVYSVQLAELRALDRAEFSHSRFRKFCGAGAYYVYRHDAKSPSGVLLAFSIDATPEADKLLCALGMSPLSPTEGL